MLRLQAPLQMYPQPPQSHRPTNSYWVLIVSTGVMLIVVFSILRTIAARIDEAVASGPITLLQFSAAPRLSISPQASPAASAVPSADVPTASAAVVDVDAKTLTESPAVYRSRAVRVRGTVFYTGKLADGKTWVQIVGDNNVYVDGQVDSLPTGIAKGTEVQMTGIGAGLTNITATNGQDYDQAFIDPIEKIEPVGG